MVDLKSAINFEHELAAKTKGNNPKKIASLAQLLDQPDQSFSDSTKKLLELEYSYAKDNAILTIGQRGEMMRVYVAAIGIVVAAGVALMRDGQASSADSYIIFGMSIFAITASIYYMRGLIILRSDWYDYVTAMAMVKIFYLRLEAAERREEVFSGGLRHDPFRVPSKDLKTNFFYHSFLLCFTVLVFSVAVVLFSGWASVAGDIGVEPLEPGMVITLIGVSTAIGVAISFVAAGVTWDAVLAMNPEKSVTEYEDVVAVTRD